MDEVSGKRNVLRDETERRHLTTWIHCRSSSTSPAWASADTRPPTGCEHQHLDMGLSDHRRILATLSVADDGQTTARLTSALRDLATQASSLPRASQVELPSAAQVELEPAGHTRDDPRRAHYR
jgi:hypothetical protein